jgi:Na+-transporting NADH:ubiquinone oxidoreductase subunit C
MSKGSEAQKTILVAALLCIVCSVLVSSTVVALKSKQERNKELDFKKNILMAAGIIEAEATAQTIDSEFEKVEPTVVDFSTGEITTEVDAKSYNQVEASSNPKLSVKIPAEKDVAGLSTRAKFAKVYLVKDGDEVKTIILNVKGKGLWSTMYGFLALDKDTTTVKGFAYYSQGETPGLGGEVDNPKWKSQWIGKKIYDNDFSEVEFAVAKGAVDSSSAMAEHKVDGLSGATITCDGVTSSMKYWFGDHAYGKFLANVRDGRI